MVIEPELIPDDESDDSEIDASSDSTTSRPRPASRRSRTRSFRTAKESLRNSDDESDVVSSAASSASSTDTEEDYDMADILANRYKHFKSFATASRSEPGREPAGLPHKLQANGKIVRVHAEPITVRGDINTASSLGLITYGLSQDVSTGRMQLTKDFPPFTGH